MTTYNEIAGRRVNFLSSDPSYVDTNSDGQVWYNSTSATLKAWLPTGAWSSGGNMNTARSGLGSAGTQTAALGFGGVDGSSFNLTATESYNGIAWTPVANLNTGRYAIAGGGLGTQTAALAIGGSQFPPFTLQTTTEKWNGTSWTASGALPTGRRLIGSSGIQTAALGFGGQGPPDASAPNINETISFNGTSWTSVPATLNTTRSGLRGVGTQTSALAFGGYTTTQVANTESYNGTSWTSVNSLNTARQDAAGSGTQTLALAFGGATATVNTTATESWNGSSWTNSTSMTTGRATLGGTPAGTQTAATAFGGYGTTYSAATEEWNFGVYSYTAAAWASGGNMNTQRTGLTGFGIQTAAIGAGGQSGPTFYTATESYNGSSWTSVNSMNTARTLVASARSSPQTAGLIFNGYTGTADSSATESWNGTSWTSVNSLNAAKRSTAGFGIQTSAIAAGGIGAPPPGAGTTILSTTESWNGTSWTSLPATQNQGRRDASGVGVSNTSGLIFGGENNVTTYYTNTESWNGSTWTAVNSMTTARAASAGFGTQTSAVCAGGINPSIVATSELWNGTSWSNIPSMSTAKNYPGGAGASNSSGLVMGGAPTAISEEWNGESQTANSKTLTTS